MLMQCRTSLHHYFLCDDELIQFHFLFILCQIYLFFGGGGGGGGEFNMVYLFSTYLPLY